MTEYRHWIVIEDPDRKYNEGSLIDGEPKARALAARGVALLPVEPEQFQKGAVAGYFKRAWGSGWPFDDLIPRMTAQTTLFVDPTQKQLHWMARIMADAETLDRPRRNIGGQIQIAADTSQRTPYSASVRPTSEPIQERNLTSIDPREGRGWLIQGKADLACQVEGLCGFALYGQAPGLRAIWVAVTSTRE